MPDLLRELGENCSYCEMELKDGHEVEHVQPKSREPTLLTSWSNFLLACKCCNTWRGALIQFHVNNTRQRFGSRFADQPIQHHFRRFRVSVLRLFDQRFNDRSQVVFPVTSLNSSTSSSDHCECPAHVLNGLMIFTPSMSAPCCMSSE